MPNPRLQPFHALAPTNISPPNLPYYVIATTATTMPPSTLQTNQSALLLWTSTLSCPATPTRFFHSLSKLTQHNVLHHPPPPIHSPSTTDQPSPIPINPLDIGTFIFYADSENGSHNLWHLGIPFILHNTDHHSPNFRNTWCRHFKHRNRSNFLRIQAHTIQAIHQFHPLLVANLPPRHACPLSLHHYQMLPQIRLVLHMRSHQFHLLWRH